MQDAVARHAGSGVNNADGLADEAIKKTRFAHIWATNDSNRREQHTNILSGGPLPWPRGRGALSLDGKCNDFAGVRSWRVAEFVAEEEEDQKEHGPKGVEGEWHGAEFIVENQDVTSCGCIGLKPTNRWCCGRFDRRRAVIVTGMAAPMRLWRRLKPGTAEDRRGCGVGRFVRPGDDALLLESLPAPPGGRDSGGDRTVCRAPLFPAAGGLLRGRGCRCPECGWDAAREECLYGGGPDAIGVAILQKHADEHHDCQKGVRGRSNLSTVHKRTADAVTISEQIYAGEGIAADEQFGELVGAVRNGKRAGARQALVALAFRRRAWGSQTMTSSRSSQRS